MSSPKRFLKCLVSATFNLPKMFHVACATLPNSANNYHRNQFHHHRKTTLQFLIGFMICMILTLVVIALLLLSYTGLTYMFTTANYIHEQSYPPHDKEMSTLLPSNGSNSGEEAIYGHSDDGHYLVENSISQNHLRRSDMQNPKTIRGIETENVFKGRNFWIRISDEVFVYSAYLDTRNFSTYYSLQNNGNLSMAGRRVATEGQVTAEYDNDDGDDDAGDSDKLDQVLLIRVIGIKAVPPLKEFIKKDILDWFRMKHEMEFSQKYECRLFFESATVDDNEADGKLAFISSSKVTYTVIEEGVKVYAGTYFNCYFNIRNNFAKISEIIRSSAGGSLQIALYPVNVSAYPTKLITVNNVMKLKKQDGLNGQNNVTYNEGTLAVCVRPLFGPFESVLKLIQFISYYHVMGITQFNFYSMSISPSVRKFLSNLSEGVVASKNFAGEGGGYDDDDYIIGKRLPRFIVHDWNLPTGNTSELWDYGTLAALNDCLFSNMDQEFVLFVDIDEFIVPQKGPFQSRPDATDIPNKKNVTLWNVIDSYDKKTTYQYLIRNTFFCNEFCEMGPNMNNTRKRRQKSEVALFPSTSFPENSNKDGNGKSTQTFPQLPIFRCMVRTKRVWNAALRSKFIVNPRQVLSVGHHLVTKYVNRKVDFRFSPGHSVQVDPHLAIMNHYRECGGISSKTHPVLTRIREVDQTMLKFENEMLEFINLLGWGRSNKIYR